MENVLRPDAKGRIGLDSLTRRLRERFGGQRISGYAAEITAEGNIVLRPRVEVDAETASLLVLGNRDRDALMDALEHPPAPGAKLARAARLYRKQVKQR